MLGMWRAVGQVEQLRGGGGGGGESVVYTIFTFISLTQITSLMQLKT
jgi:hypothetical protein